VALSWNYLAIIAVNATLLLIVGGIVATRMKSRGYRTLIGETG
jgi:hypothetical protein